jgi:hypothetical protein
LDGCSLLIGVDGGPASVRRAEVSHGVGLELGVRVQELDQANEETPEGKYRMIPSEIILVIRG